jgi:basic membrane protein A
MKKGLVVALVAVLCCFCAGMAFSMEAVPVEELKPGFVFISPAGDGGWTFMHEKGRQEMEAAFPGLKSTFVEGVPEGPDSSRVMNTFIRNGSKLIFATSFGYMDFVQEVAKRHPDVYFMHCSGYKRGGNVGTYFGRMYQPRYLSGLVAGSMTESNVLGYVAAQPIPEVIRGINAFTLGVRHANPQAKVKVVWLFSWFDPGKEKEATKALIDAGADVIAMHADSGSTPQTAEEAGVYVVGYNNDMSHYAPTKHLTAPIWHWGKVYTYTVDKIVNGTWESEDIWWGLKEGLVELAPFGPAVPDSVKELVAAEEAKILAGTWDVFTGPIKDQKGEVRVPEGEVMSDGDMLSMSWFVEGVEGEIPK